MNIDSICLGFIIGTIVSVFTMVILPKKSHYDNCYKVYDVAACQYPNPSEQCKAILKATDCQVVKLHIGGEG